MTTTSTRPSTDTTPTIARAATAAGRPTRRHPTLPPFRTPVRGHAYAARPPEAPPPRPGQPARLVPEPDNPADGHAVAVWVGDGTHHWRIGYLDRGVAARVAPRLRAGQAMDARIDGWVREPNGRWQRPVLLLLPEDRRPAASDRPTTDAPDPSPAAPAAHRADGGRIWGRPPGVVRRTLGPPGAARQER